MLLDQFNPETALIPTRTKRRAMDWSLVLASQDISATIQFDEAHRWVLAVDARDYPRAMETIRLYRHENRHWHWQQQLPWSDVTFHWGAVMVCLLLTLVHQISFLVVGLRDRWVFEPGAVAAGQWWRLFTAVLLHGDVAHLLANVMTGVLLFALAMARFGAGTALCAAYLAGAFGNLAGLWLYTRPYTGLGASGAVMGALGLLAFNHASLWRTDPARTKDLLRATAAGALLFVIFGVDPRSDVIAHLGGFVAGAVFGTALSFLPNAILTHRLFVAGTWALLIALLVVTGWLGLSR